MAVTLPADGQEPWSVPLNTVLHLLTTPTFMPNDHGYQAWSADPVYSVGGANPGTGVVRMVKMTQNPFSYTITNVVTFINTAGVALTAGQCFAGVYDSAGTRQAITADQSGVWNTTGLKSMAVTVPYVVPANAEIWLALLYNGTSCSFAGTGATAGQNDLINASLAAADYRYTNGPTAQTTLPASVTMGTRVTTPQSTWLAAS